jgi:alkaline phosphatase D
VELVTQPGKGKVIAVKYPQGTSLADIRNAVPGTTGEVRVGYRPGSNGTWLKTDWAAVDPQRDFTRQFLLEGLQPNRGYSVIVESRQSADGPGGQSLKGRFRTAPAPDDPARVVFTVSTGQAYGDQDDPGGYKIYAAMLKLKPSFFVHTGDIVYYDRLAKTAELARYHWQRTYSLPTNVRFHRQVASYFIKDDHDAWQNDCWPTMSNEKMFEFTFQQGLAIFPEQVPMGELTYRTRRWGKDLQIWMVEGRDYRSANPDPDGPNKTIWGAEQKAWFKRTVQESDAAFRVLISPTPLVGPDRKNKNDNHSNAGFTHEGDELREFIAGQKNMAVVCGDRHWQYLSIHPKTKVREYSCGPASDGHAGGWKDEYFYPEYHRFLKVKGGFLSASVERIDGKPTLTFRHHGVDGQVRNEDRLVAE